MPKKVDPTVDTAVDVVFGDAESRLTARIDELQTKRDALAKQIAPLESELAACRQQLDAVKILKSAKAGVLY